MPKENYKVFISYERRDSAGWASLLYRQLSERYASSAVFKDEEATHTGTRWASRLERLVRDCEVYILVIGPDWSEQRVLDKLRDPENWVRKEILAALDHQKLIFPVFVGGAAGPPSVEVPPEVRPAITAVHRFEFKGMRSWDTDLERLCSDIETATSLEPASALPPLTSYDRMLCRLDRNEEAGCVKQCFEDGRRLFLASGAARAGFRHFAIRCALDVIIAADSSTGARRAGGKKELMVPLNWLKFSEPEDAIRRKEILFEEIAECLLAESATRKAAEREEVLRSWIRRNPRPTVIYSTAVASAGSLGARCREWFDTWLELLGDDAPKNLAVILFVKSGWFRWLSIDERNIEECGSVVRPGLGKVRKRHLDEWLRAEVTRRVSDQRLRRSIRNRAVRLFRLLPARNFEDIDRAVYSIWDEDERG